MPIYEFECRTCHRKTAALVMVRERVTEVRCTHCGGADLERLWSRFASPKSEDARLDSLADPSAMSGLDENDPRSVAQFMKRMGKEMGEDVGDDIEQAVEQEMGGAGGEGDEGGLGGGMGGGDDDFGGGFDGGAGGSGGFGGLD
jgi:putative FmdB family regulatory protein